MRLCIYGGSFNPPHVGHAAAVRAAQREANLDEVRVIPAAMPPHKALASGSPGAEERLELCRLAFGDLPGVTVSDLELRREGKSYTVDTVRAIRAEEPDAELCLLVGTDMLRTFDEWREFQTILQNVTLLASARDDDDLETVRFHAARLEREYGARVEVIETPPLPLSSTQIRRLLPERHGAEFLAATVYARIVRKRLYGAKPSLDWLREESYPFLHPRRVAHVWGCEHEARSLAKRWGADEGDAAEAGILHDITKKLTPAEQLLLSEKYGIINDTNELKNAKLFHAKTGAALSRDLFGVPEEIESAIRWHTTAHENMTLLEQIIYLADYIEPTRDFPGVERLRKLAYEDLRAAMILGLEMGLEEIRAEGREPHENSVRALEWFRREAQS